MTEERLGAQGLAEAVGGRHDDDAMLREVVSGLRESTKRISSKFHYDERGSALFEKITRLEEYYPTRTERALLESTMPVWVDELRPATLVELGAGNAEKSRIILNAMTAAGSAEAYVPVDVSHDFLHETARKIRAEYPALQVAPAVADITSPIDLPKVLAHPRWIAFLGSTLGNFEGESAVELLARVASRLEGDDRFLLGVDLRPGAHKSADRIELAYNDAAGVTAEFSLNVLAVLNAELGSDFELTRFRHRARYVVEAGRIETDLVSTAHQTVRFPDGTEIDIAEGEAIRTEVSCKYDRPTIDELFERVGLVVDHWVEDDLGYYALVLGISTP